MIGGRLVGMGRAAPAQRRGTIPLKERAARRPAIAGRQILTDLLDQSWLMQLMLAMFLVSVAALIYLNQASQVSVLQYSIADLQREQTQLTMQRANLYATATSLQVLSRVQTLASTELHMKPDSATPIWITPVVPKVAPLAPDTSAQRAVQQSQPLSVMRDFVQFVGAQL